MPFTPEKKIIHKTDDTLNAVTPPIYIASVVLLHVLYLLVFFGFYSVNTTYIRYLSTFIQVFVALFLIYRFNPLRKIVIHPHDGTIIFGSGMFLLTNTLFTETFVTNVEGKVKKMFPWLSGYLPSFGGDTSKNSSS
jgi:hypothetical protein